VKKFFAGVAAFSRHGAEARATVGEKRLV